VTGGAGRARPFLSLLFGFVWRAVGGACATLPAMRILKTLTASALAGLALAGTASAADASVAQLREFECTVVSVNRDARTFRLRDSERGTFRFKVTSRTRFERVAGFSGLRRGQTRIEVTARRSNGRWIAAEVERSGGGGEHGGDDD
jgi:hypothetical protein